MSLPTQRRIIQNAWVVPNLEQACLKWVEEMGVGPFFVSEFDMDVFSFIEYRGEPSELCLKVAVAHAGNLQIELIESKTPKSAYRDVVAEGCGGFHHMCVSTEDFEADRKYFEALGYTAATMGRISDLEFAYYDTRALLGCMFEVVTRTQSFEERYQEIANSCENWDGENPIR